MRNPPMILIADDNAANLDILRTRLASQDYDVVVAINGEEALEAAKTTQPDLILLDVMMPKTDGLEVCRRLKKDPTLPFMPIIMVTAKSDTPDVVKGLEAGADEYLTKPVDQTALVARVKSMLRIKELHDTTQAQAAELASWNEHLEQRVAEQSQQLERMSHLKRFFSPQLAEFMVSSDGEQLMATHRKEITAVFCDLKGFTAFAETAEPEEVMGALKEYHNAVGPLTFRFEATLEHIVGDGLTAFFNDPLPCSDPSARAVRMAVAMHQEVGRLIARWRKQGFDLGFGIGIAKGFATLGQIGFEGQFHYGAIGSVLNLASRLCDHTKPGQTLITQRVYAEIEALAEVEPVGDLTLKGFHRPVPVFSVLGCAAAEREPATHG